MTIFLGRLIFSLKFGVAFLFVHSEEKQNILLMYTMYTNASNIFIYVFTLMLVCTWYEEWSPKA